MARDVYQEVTDKIVSALENGVQGAWTPPWQGMAGLPVSLQGRPYRGINVPILLSAGYSSPVWGTFKGWQKAGHAVRKGEKATMAVLWKPWTKTERVWDEDSQDYTDQKVSRLFAKAFSLFNAEQVTPVPDFGQSPGVVEDDDKADAMIRDFGQSEGIAWQTVPDKACYIPAMDTICLPPRADFVSTAGFYSTVFHEMGHSTGASSRLDRDLSGRFGDSSYAMEELVAELSATMVAVSLGIEAEPREDHAKYLDSWLACLKADKRAIFTVSSRAQQAADYIVAYHPDTVQETAKQTKVA